MEYQSGVVSPIKSIEQGWQIIKNDYWMYVLMILVFAVVIIISSLILGAINQAITSVIAGILGIATTNSGNVAQVSAAIIPHIVAQAVSFFTSIILTTLSGVLICGIYKSLTRVSSGGSADFGDLFSGFEHIQACFIVAIITSVINFIIGVVYVIAAVGVGAGALLGGVSGLMTSDGQINTAVLGGLMLIVLAFVGISLVVQLIISSLTAFVYPLIAERNMSGGQAFLVSVKSGLSNLIGLILLMILMFLMLLAGAFACLIGMLFVAPIIISSLYAAFQSVFGKLNTYQQYNPPPPPNFGQQPGW